MAFNMQEYVKVTEDHNKILEDDVKEANKIIGSLRAENRRLRRELLASKETFDNFRNDNRFYALTLEREKDQFAGSVEARLRAGKHLTCLTKGNKLKGFPYNSLFCDLNYFFQRV